jgi:hypothetical protein
VRQTAQKAVQKGRRKKREEREGAGRRIRQRLTKLTRPTIVVRVVGEEEGDFYSRKVVREA